ncbi:MAG: hypothetical protein UT24_C0033G0012 [Candidatus Woesebacteria bacterium GW2011_GWB1_39_12]|uniref:Uncharacterized protein n=1 Tax=Candidatus Woesebacteria bacterium GW2011_GWB1_39_12 TaxID=1618574 RepID=A0A0G0M6K2_9BACT|nr:MAG: hypothetical protein UT24_C0033G0012 [Candidatus Woesebacteria bacterium GW2011_GWB1_39_12]
MGADYYFETFLGMPLGEVVEMTTEEVSQTKYNEDTGKQYQIKKTTEVWRFNGQEYHPDGQRDDDDDDNDDLESKFAKKFGLEFCKGYYDMECEDILIGVSLARGNIEYDSLIQEIPEEKIEKARGRILEAFHDSNPRLFAVGYCSV